MPKVYQHRIEDHIHKNMRAEHWNCSSQDNIRAHSSQYQVDSEGNNLSKTFSEITPEIGNNPTRFVGKPVTPVPKYIAQEGVESLESSVSIKTSTAYLPSMETKQKTSLDVAR